MAVTQSHYRFGINELAESTHGWHAAEDANPAAGVIALDTTFLLRFTLQCDGTAQSNVDAEFQYRLNGGTWTNITTSSNVVRAVTTSVFANAANTTKRLSGTGTFETSSAGCTHDGISGGTAFDIVANGNGETECSMQLRSADLADGDVVEFRLTRDGGTLLNTYAVTPSLTISIPTTPTRGQVSFAEVEVPFIVTRGLASVFEFEVPLVSTRGQVSQVEFEAPLVQARGQASWLELQVPDDVPPEPTRGQLGFAELEFPFVVTRGQASFIEFEVPLVSTRGRASFVEFEVPLTPTRGRLSFTDVVVDFAPARGQVSFIEFQLPLVGEGSTVRRYVISFSREMVQRS
jgi:hypothetical protein